MSSELPKWAETAAAFLSENLPEAWDRPGWQHKSSTAYQIGCDGLVRLGFATSTKYGAVPKETPTCPEALPRWDDICISVLWLAHQHNLLSFRLPDGSLPPRTIRSARLGVIQLDGASPPPPANIQSRHGLGPAFCRPEILTVLERIDLVSEDVWTSAAEYVLWRTSPKVWNLEFQSDERFLKATQEAVASIPRDIQNEIENLVHITEADIDEHLARQAEANEEARKRHGANAPLAAVANKERARRSLEFIRKGEVDWVFFRRWRMDCGWLSRSAADATIAVFHDSLAVAMRKAVIEKLYPSARAFFE